jgi:hypothetical protein
MRRSHGSGFTLVGDWLGGASSVASQARTSALDRETKAPKHSSQRLRSAPDRPSTKYVRPSLFTKRIEPADWEFELRPNYCLNVAGWIVSEDERMGVWVGDTVAVTEDGVRKLHRSPVDQIEANILAQ